VENIAKATESEAVVFSEPLEPVRSLLAFFLVKWELTVESTCSRSAELDRVGNWNNIAE